MELNRIINQNCLTGLAQLPDNSVDCCVTSPPYFGLRDYGNPEQIGLEETPELFVQQLVNVFAEVKRVLKPTGTLWLNIGDSYAGSGRGLNGDGTYGVTNSPKQRSNKGTITGHVAKTFKSADYKPKDLIGIPWMVAFALRSNGWYLRQDIIWHKPNPMPESVTDRCTKAHEYIFLMSKSNRYFYDTDAIKEDIAETTVNDKRLYDLNYQAERTDRGFPGSKSKSKGLMRPTTTDILKRNKRSVWTVSPAQLSDVHFATFPEYLIVDCIKAGCPENGIVLDPFMGAGTTAVVSKKLGRNYLGYELNPQYLEIANNRLYAEIGMFL